MEKIEKFNLELALFNTEMNLFIQNVNKIDAKTLKLLAETIENVNKLHATSICRTVKPTNDSRFVESLNNDIFDYRRYIICTMCEEQIPLNSDDFNMHIQRQSHRDKEFALQQQQQQQQQCSNQLESIKIATLTTSLKSADEQHANQTKPDQKSDQNANISTNSTVADHNGNHNSSSKSANSDKPQIPTIKLMDVIDVDRISRTIVATAVDLTSRSTKQICYEKQIVKLLTGYLKKFDNALRMTPFGSTTYGYGGTNTNFNILVNAGSASNSAIESLRNFEKFLSKKSDFLVLATINGNRVQKRRIQVIHKESDLRCSIQFDVNFDLAKSSQILRDCISYAPICYHLIAYVRAWQNQLNDAAVQNGFLFAFRFNTYIISVLVIFYLQLNYDFPKLADVPPSHLESIGQMPPVDKAEFKQAVCKFFEFYGRKYEKCKLISLSIGRWQNIELNRKQTVFSPEQKLVREGMKANPRAWEKCTMFVQDIQSPSINITAELTEEEVDSFKQICKLFISFKLHEKNIDEYVSKMPKISATSSCRSLKPNHALSPEKINTERSQSAVNATKNLSDEPTAKDPIPDVIPKQKMIPTHIEPHPGFASSTPQKLPKSVDINKISRFIKIGAIDFIFRTLERISFEEDIVGLLVRNLKAYDSKLEAMAFGSSTFGFGGCHTDVNILVSTGGSTQKPIIALRSFDRLMKLRGAQSDFEVKEITQGDRVQSRRMRLIHIVSKIECTLQFDDNYELAESSKLIRGFITHVPICHHLIAYIKAWQNALNATVGPKGSYLFRFNTYIISVLAIFFLQVQHKSPKLADVPPTNEKYIDCTPHIDRGKLKQTVYEFFEFYGNQYDIENHVISVNIGEWQNRHKIGQQGNLTPEQKRLQSDIEFYAFNWKNCTMHVQDIKSPGRNITAEIPEVAANNFKGFCKLFASPDLHDQIIDEYMQNVLQSRTAFLDSVNQF